MSRTSDKIQTPCKSRRQTVDRSYPSSANFPLIQIKGSECKYVHMFRQSIDCRERTRRDDERRVLLFRNKADSPREQSTGKRDVPKMARATRVPHRSRRASAAAPGAGHGDGASGRPKSRSSAGRLSSIPRHAGGSPGLQRIRARSDPTARTKKPRLRARPCHD